MTVCLVTGGAGFIGSHLVEGLLARRYQVRVLDNFSTGLLANIAHLLDRIELVVGDVADLDLVRQATQGINLVFHHAAPVEWGLRVADPEILPSVRFSNMQNILVAARDNGVQRVIFASSAAVYGPPKPFPVSEEYPARPLSPHAVATLTGEQECTAFTSLYGVETVRLRYFNVFGPRQPGFTPYAEVILQALQAMLFGRQPVLYGEGLQPQDFIFVEDVVHANLLVAEGRRVSGRVFNIGRGRPTTAREVIVCLNALLGTDLQPLHRAPCPRRDLHNLADISRCERELGFCPTTDLETGLRRCIVHYQRCWDQFHSLRQPSCSNRALACS